MHALVADVFADRDRCRVEGLVGRIGIADVPAEDVVVVDSLAVRAGRLAFEVVTNHDCTVVHCRERVDQHVEVFVLDLDEFDRIGRNVAILGDDERDFLLLEADLAVGEHHLLVARERRHPVQVQRLEVLGRQDGEHAGVSEGRFLVDGDDAAVRDRAPDEGAEDFAG